jgi:hypothetical protein
VAWTAGAVSRAWPRKNDAKATISQVTSATAPKTSALAASTGGRRGAAPNVARIVPVLYSAVMASTPRTPMVSRLK